MRLVVSLELVPKHKLRSTSDYLQYFAKKMTCIIEII